jgi:outer membrane biogenesis lipoprotein LolB
MIRLPILVLSSLLLAACTEKPQTVARKADDKPWAATTTHLAPGYQAGNESAWEVQLKTRAQGQNEYNRTDAR